jgi:heptosyltransferase II
MNLIDHQNVSKIFVRVTNWIGDAVMNTPALGAIRASYPRSEIVVVANPIVAEILSPHPHCDRVIVFDKKGNDRGIAGFLRFTAALRQDRFDVAILLQKAVEAALMAFLARIPVRVGYPTDGRRLLLTHSTPFSEEVSRQHHSEHYLHLLRQFRINGGDGRQRLQCTETELAWADSLLGSGTWAAINPGAAYGSAKRWIPERFAAVGDRLAAEYGVRIVLIGGPGEGEIGCDVEAAMSSKPFNLIGRTSVRQMMAILSRCRLMVTNDSGPMHVAAALGVPIAAIFGATDHTTTYPLTDNHRIIRKEFDCAPCLLRRCPTDHQCMEAVTVDDVMRAVRELLQTDDVGI